MSTPSLRCDAPLIRHIAKDYDNFLGARLWQDLPLICLDEHVWRTLLGNDRVIRDAEIIRWRPFDDFIIYREYSPDDSSASNRDIDKMWLRITTPEVCRNTFHSMYFLPLPQRWKPEGILCTVWLLLRNKEFVIEFIEILTDKSGEVIVYNTPNTPENKQLAKEFTDRCRYHAYLASCAIAYLSMCNEYLIEEHPAGMPPRRKVKDIKPWTYAHLPRIILLDPTQAPRLPGQDHGGTHASPRPHQRRGHWRRLLAPRYHNRGSRIFVKPQWIGPREWILNGSVYRVLDEANRPQPKGPTSIERAVMEALDTMGVPYEPQKVIGRCVVDIFIAPNVVLELDGLYWHNLPGAQERDAKRDAWLRSRGYAVYRLKEDAINVDAYGAVYAILEQIRKERP